MILIGQYDSPFVRRVAIALDIYGLPFEHRPWSTFGDADKLAAYNPLTRVPTLVLDDNTALVESGVMLDWLDEQVGPVRALIPDRGLARRNQLRTSALTTGLADKGVSLLYERVLHTQKSAVWEERCRTQIGAVLAVLEAERAALATPYWFGAAPGHADIVVACVLRFIAEAHAGLFDRARYPALAGHAARCEALEPFRRYVQPLIPPKS
jgi:glutathione S-transferase